MPEHFDGARHHTAEKQKLGVFSGVFSLYVSPEPVLATVFRFLKSSEWHRTKSRRRFFFLLT